MQTRTTTLALALALAAGTVQAQSTAQATVKPDGVWRSALDFGASLASGNTDSNTVTLSGDAVQQSTGHRNSLYGQLLYAETDGTTSSQQVRLGGRHDRDLSAKLFGYGGLNFEHNPPANLQFRAEAGGGLGWRVLNSPSATWNLFGGLVYTADRYTDARDIDGVLRTRHNYLSLMLAEESTHAFSDTTTAKQRLALMPNLENSGEYRARWDAALAVAMNQWLALSIGLGVAYDSDPGAGRKTTDTLFTAGITMRFD